MTRSTISAALPADLQAALSRSQFTVSLRTSDRRIAVVRARALAAQTDALYLRMSKCPADGPNDRLSSDFTMEFRLDEGGVGQIVTVSTEPGDAADREGALEVIRIVQGARQTPAIVHDKGTPFEGLHAAVVAYLVQDSADATERRLVNDRSPIKRTR